jgi:hypothetical protein
LKEVCVSRSEEKKGKKKLVVCVVKQGMKKKKKKCWCSQEEKINKIAQEAYVWPMEPILVL